MKKILMLVSGLVLSTSVFATALEPGGTAGTTSRISKSTGSITCDALESETDTTPVKVGLSKENLGAIECSATDIGVAVTSPKGKGKVFSSNSGGGALADADCADPLACAQSDADTGATDALTAASAS